MGKRKGFWGKFDDLMDSLPDHIDREIKSAEKSINTMGNNNVVINGNSSVRQTSWFGKSVSVIKQGGNKIEITTKNGVTTIKVNGNEYVPKERK